MKNKGTSKSMAKSDLRKNKKVTDKISKQSYAIILFGISLIMFCVVFIPGESSWLALHNLILGLFGVCSVLWPIFLSYISIMFAFGKLENKNSKLQIYLACFVIILVCLEVYIFSSQNISNPREFLNHLSDLYKKGVLNSGSGVMGGLIGAPLVWLIGITGLRVTNTILLLISVMFLTGMTLSTLLKGAFKPFLFVGNKVKEYKEKRTAKNVENGNENNGINKRKCKIDIPIDNNSTNKTSIENTDINDKSAYALDINSYDESEEIEKVTEAYIKKIKKENEKSTDFKMKTNDLAEIKEGEYKYPPIKLLNESEKIDESATTKEINSNSKMLVDTLKSFNVETKFIGVSRGPTVTRYELQPASGVKISKITSLADDVALNLAASGVRIEAPIPGKAAVGVEIPNKIVSAVNMRELIASPAFRKAGSKLTVVLGKDISGRIIVTDLSKMPHLLIAGSTGSGKSVCINSFIISLIYKASPEEVKMVMIDPKVVELGVYNDIPHLLTPVVTDPKKAKGALSWAVDEMLRRYKVFARTNVRDMHSYNMYVSENPGAKDSEGNNLKKMYSIVIIIDELSDLMMAAPNEVEDYICRLAQMARAAGMHLVIATQRPSVDVITGIIKANIPSRIALAVSSQVDSRTILDMSGAEKLLGRGDMLFSPIGSTKPLRVQGCYVTDKEIESIVDYVKIDKTNGYDDKVTDEIINKAENSNDKDNSSSQDDSDKDPMLNDAIQCVVEAGQASTSLLQRRLRLGYARAGRLIDEMEELGIVGPHEGSKPRQVLINRQQFIEMNLRNSD